MVTSQRSWKRRSSTVPALRLKSGGQCRDDKRSPDMATVLVVEDNAANMKLVKFLLESAGHTVVSAADAENGLTLARDVQPNLILMDIQLPRMDGLEDRKSTRLNSSHGYIS